MSSNPLLNASLMQLFHAPGMGSNPLMPNMQMFSPGLGMNAPMPQQQMPQQQMPQQPMQQMPPQMQEVEQALMSGMGTPGMQAMGAFEEGVAPFEQEWANTQNRRFTRGGLGLGETIYDMIREKKLSPQRQAVDAQRARMAQEEALKQADQKYKDAKTILRGRDSNLNPDEIDAMARRYAQGEDMNKLSRDTRLTEMQRRQLEQTESANQQSAALQAMKDSKEFSAEQIKQAEVIYDNSKDTIKSWEKADRNMAQINDVAEKGWKGQGAGQVTALYSMIKALDPDSVVREGEVRLAQMGESLINQFLAQYEGVTENTIMSEEMYNDVINLTQSINELSQASYADAFASHIGQAEARGIPPELVYGDHLLSRISAGSRPRSDIGISDKDGEPAPEGRARDLAEAADGNLTQEEIDYVMKFLQ